jgi:hypothetical protein
VLIPVRHEVSVDVRPIVVAAHDLHATTLHLVSRVVRVGAYVQMSGIRTWPVIARVKHFQAGWYGTACEFIRDAMRLSIPGRSESTISKNSVPVASGPQPFVARVWGQATDTKLIESAQQPCLVGGVPITQRRCAHYV